MKLYNLFCVVEIAVVSQQLQRRNNDRRFDQRRKNSERRTRTKNEVKAEQAVWGWRWNRQQLLEGILTYIIGSKIFLLLPGHLVARSVPLLMGSPSRIKACRCSRSHVCTRAQREVSHDKQVRLRLPERGVETRKLYRFRSWI